MKQDALGRAFEAAVGATERSNKDQGMTGLSVQRQFKVYKIVYKILKVCRDQDKPVLKVDVSIFVDA